MPRVARIKGEFTTYHIILRGNEKKNIFLDIRDKERFLATLSKIKTRYNFYIYAYCLMDNHVHIIINDNGNDISLIMKSLGISYALYFNKKYERSGHLFQDRFRSEIVSDDNYLLELSKYIHNNPVKAGIVREPIQYRWSSFKEYVDNKYYEKYDVLSTRQILGMFSNKLFSAQQLYYKYVNAIEDDKKVALRSNIIADEENTNSMTINDAKERLKNIAKLQGLEVNEMIKNRKMRDEIIKDLRKNTSLKLKEIAELMGGLSESRVSRILKD